MAVQYNTSSIVTNGLVLYLDAANSRSYPGAGTTWNDLSGNGNTSTLVNGPTYSSLNSGGIVLDGSNDYINCGTASSLKIDQGNFTIFSLCYIVSRPSGQGTFFYQSGDGDGGFSGKSIFFQCNGDNELKLEFYGPSATGTFTGGFVVNSTNFVAVKFNRTTGATKFFRNGVFSSNLTLLGSPSFTSLTSTQIGRRYRASAGYSVTDLGARVNVTMVYNRELSDAEISQNYNALKARYEL